MFTGVRRAMNGDVVFTLTVEEGDTLQGVREAINGFNKKYTRYGYMTLTTNSVIINNLPTFVFAFDNSAIAMKKGEDGVYRMAEYSEMDGFLNI
jgi:hypothetical protein